MKLETLEKNNKKKILIGGLIGVCLVSVIGFTTTRAKYKSIQNLKIANGTIKYTSSDLNLIAMYQANEIGTYDTITSVPTGNYSLNTVKSVCNVDGIKDTSIKIEYINGKINIVNLTKKGTKCYLYFDEKTTETVNTAFGTIVAKLATPDFSKTATTDEGIYAMADGMYGGTSYYWRGDSTTNHVIFAEKCWRIVRINGDGTIRLIYNGAVLSGNKCTGNGSNSGSVAVSSQAYNPSYDRSEYVGYTYTTGSQRTTGGSPSNLKTQTDSWYNTNITETNVAKVADGKFCNDRNTASESSWSSQPSSTFYYAGYDRRNGNPTLACLTGDIYTLKAGAITMDEVLMAGSGKHNTSNSSYYLYNGQYYWTMSPYSWYYYNSSSRDAAVFLVYNNGSLNDYGVHNATPGVRPVINLKSDTTFATGGNGTTDKPYVVQ